MKQNKDWIKKHPVWTGMIGFVVLLLIVGMFAGGDVKENSQSIDKNKFNKLSIKSLYDNGFCYEGMNCGEADYPFIRIYNAEDFSEQGKMLLITQVTDDLYKEFPGLYDREIVYIFRDKNQKTVDRIYVKEDKWGK